VPAPKRCFLTFEAAGLSVEPGDLGQLKNCKREAGAIICFVGVKTSSVPSKTICFLK